MCVRLDRFRVSMADRESEDTEREEEAVVEEQVQISGTPAEGAKVAKDPNDLGDPSGKLETGAPSSLAAAQHRKFDLENAPPNIKKSVRVLEHKSKETGAISTIYLVGTAHVSKASCEEVEAAIRYFQPEAVFIELCKDRRFMVLQSEKHEVPSVKTMLDLWRTKKMNAFGICYSYFLAKVAEQLDVLPGAEFKTAFEEGRACHADIIFGDRPVNITLQRTWSKMSFWTKVRLGYHMLCSIILLPSVEELNKMLAETSDTDVLTILIREYSKQFPTLIDTLLYERDLFMTYVLQNLVEKYTATVAVVGRGHVSGIIENWEKSIELDPLLQVPDKKSSIKFRWVFAVCGVAISVIYWKHRHS